MKNISRFIGKTISEAGNDITTIVTDIVTTPLKTLEKTVDSLKETIELPQIGQNTEERKGITLPLLPLPGFENMQLYIPSPFETFPLPPLPQLEKAEETTTKIEEKVISQPVYSKEEKFKLKLVK